MKLLSFNRLFAGLLVVVLAAHLVAGPLLAKRRPAFVLQYDGDDYRDLAVSLATGQGFSISRVRWFEAPRIEQPVPEAFRPPLLPLLAAPFLIGNPESLFRLLLCQAVLFTLLTGVLGLLLRRVAGDRAAWAGVILLNLHPLFLGYSLTFSTEILFTLGLTIFLWVWTLRTPWKWALLGAVTAATVWARPTALPLFVLSAAAIPFVTARGTRLRALVAVTAAFLLVLSPWAVRNRVVFGEWKTTSWFGGYNFWLGNNQLNRLAYGASSDREFLRYQEQAWNQGVELAKSLTAPEFSRPSAQEAFWYRTAREEIREMSWRNWAGLLAAKAWHFWRPWPLRDAHAAGAWRIVALFESLLFAAGLAGAWRLGRQSGKGRALLLPLLLVLVCGTGVHALIHVYMRHRVPFVDLAMILCAAAGLFGRTTPSPGKIPAGEPEAVTAPRPPHAAAGPGKTA